MRDKKFTVLHKERTSSEPITRAGSKFLILEGRYKKNRKKKILSVYKNEKAALWTVFTLNTADIA